MNRKRESVIGLRLAELQWRKENKNKRKQKKKKKRIKKK